MGKVVRGGIVGDCTKFIDLVELKNIVESFEKKDLTLGQLRARLFALTKKNKAIKDVSLEEVKHMDEFMKSIKDKDDFNVDTFVKMKIGEKDVTNIGYNIKDLKALFGMFQKGIEVNASDKIAKYDLGLVNEINLLNSFGEKGVMLQKYYTNHLESIQAKFKKFGFDKKVIDELENDMSVATHGSIKESMGVDGWVHREFNMGYTVKELQDFELSIAGKTNQEQLIKDWKAGHKGFINYFDYQLEKEASNLRIKNTKIDIEEDLINLSKGVLEPVTKILDETQKRMNNKEGRYFVYGQNKGSFLKDLMNSFMGDPQFVLRHKILKKGTSSVSDFIDYFITKYEKMNQVEVLPGTKIYNKIKSDANKIYYTFMDRTRTNSFINSIKNIQTARYTSKYHGIASGGYGHISMLKQLTQNHVELLGYIKQISDSDLMKIKQLVDRIGDFGEGGFTFGTGLEREGLEGTGLGRGLKELSLKTKQSVEYIGKKFGIRDEYLLSRIGNIIEMGLSAPMTFDALADEPRRMVAMYKILQKFEDGLYDLDNETIATLVRGEYVRLGGGVISSSPLYRENAWMMLDPTKFGYPLANTFMTLFRFMKNWSLTKTINFAEVWMNGFHATALLTSKNANDVKLGKVFLKEFAGFNVGLIKSIFTSMVIYARVERTNQSKESDKIDGESFVKNLSNQFVAFEIVLGQELSSINALAESLGGENNLTTENQSKKIMFEYLKKLIYHVGVGFGIPKYIKKYIDVNPDADIVDIITSVRKDFFGRTFKYGNELINNTLIDGQKTNDPLGFFLVGDKTKQNLLDDEIYKLKSDLKYIEGEKDYTGWIGIIANLFSYYIDPSDSPINDRASQEVVEKIVKDPGLRDLLNNGASNYDIDEMYNKNNASIAELFKELQYVGVGDELLPDLTKRGSNRDEFLGTAWSFDIMDKLVTTTMKDNGMTMDELLSIKNGSNSANMNIPLAKIYVAIQQQYPEKIKYILPYLVQKEYLDSSSNYKKNIGRYKLEVSENEILQKDAIKKYLPLFDLNDEAKQILMKYHVQTFLPDVYGNENAKKKLEPIVQGHLSNLSLATKNLPESGTDVKYLTSSTRVALGNIAPKTNKGKKMYADYVLNSLIQMEYSDLPPKERIAKQASFLLGMTKEGSEILNNDENFNRLSKSARYQLANWYYKTSVEMDQYTTEILDSDYKKGSGSGDGYTKKPYFRYSSPNMSGQRPGFNKQFPQEIPKPLIPYIKPNFQDFINAGIKNTPRQASKLYLPLLKEIQRLTLNVQFQSIYSKDLFSELGFTTGEPKKEFVKTNVAKRYTPSTNKVTKLKKPYARKIKTINLDGASSVEFINNNKYYAD